MQEEAKINQEIGNIQIIEDFSLEDLKIIYESLGSINLTLNSPIFERIIKLRDKVKTKFESKQRAGQK